MAQSRQCLAGTKYMRALGVKREDLLKTDMCVRGAGNQKIDVLGVLLVSLSQPGSSSHSKQMVYICEGVTGPLLSLEACQDLGLVDQDFPRHPPTITVSLSWATTGCPTKRFTPLKLIWKSLNLKVWPMWVILLDRRHNLQLNLATRIEHGFEEKFSDWIVQFLAKLH